MIRLFKYTLPDDNGNIIEDEYRDFPNYLFSRPYGIIFVFPEDKVIIYNVAYRISSKQIINDSLNVNCICKCCCGGGGSGSGGDGAPIKIITDESLQGEGNDPLPLGVQISKMTGNRLMINDDGVYGAANDYQYVPPVVMLTSDQLAGEYVQGQTLTMKLSITVEAGSAGIANVLLFQGDKSYTLSKSEGSGSAMYWKDFADIDSDTVFYATVFDGKTHESNRLSYIFVETLYCGVSDKMTLTQEEILATDPIKISGSFEHSFNSDDQYMWMCCPKNMIVKTITGEGGFDIMASFGKTDVEIDGKDYALYMYDEKITTDKKDYPVTFNFE